jgi:hypothetical protein
MASKNDKNLKEKSQKVAMYSNWGRWSRSSELTQESRSNDPISEGLHMVSILIVLQLSWKVKDDFGLIASRKTNHEEPYESRGSRTVLWEVWGWNSPLPTRFILVLW